LLDDENYLALKNAAIELLKMITSSIKTAKNSLNREST